MLLFNTVLEKLKDSMVNYRMAESIDIKEQHLKSIEGYIDLLLDSEDIDLMLRKNMLPTESNTTITQPNRINIGSDNITLLNNLTGGSIEPNPKRVGVVESITNDFMNQSQR